MTGACAAAGAYAATAAVGVSLTDQSVSVSSDAPTTASYTISNDGKVRNQENSILESWLLSGSASSYEVRATVTSGAVTSGTVGTWFVCSSDQTWTLNNPPRGNVVATAVLTIEIRDAATATVRASASITLQAEHTSDSGGGGF
jgi:hypothetical protein